MFRWNELWKSGRAKSKTTTERAYGFFVKCQKRTCVKHQLVGFNQLFFLFHFFRFVLLLLCRLILSGLFSAQHVNFHSISLCNTESIIWYDTILDCIWRVWLFVFWLAGIAINVTWGISRSLNSFLHFFHVHPLASEMAAKEKEKEEMKKT